ncbi:hypothetical protein PR048_031511 [Dryococelus australis]|uniref:Uncharacterized protein n=1 Tax=Dryococelus australis TaxID=614101 RepID=A0ABQ9G675_9NEOP|nr:hypothetical protein PR048_031511 [Dryococelus australis]
MQGWGKREIPEETRRPAASSGTIPTCENPGGAPTGNRTRFAEPARIPPRRTGFSPRPGRSQFTRVGIVLDDVSDLWDLPFPPALAFRRYSMLTSITHIGSQDLAATSRPNPFTHLLQNTLVRRVVVKLAACERTVKVSADGTTTIAVHHANMCGGFNRRPSAAYFDYDYRIGLHLSSHVKAHHKFVSTESVAEEKASPIQPAAPDGRWTCRASRGRYLNASLCAGVRDNSYLDASLHAGVRDNPYFSNTPAGDDDCAIVRSPDTPRLRRYLRRKRRQLPSAQVRAIYPATSTPHSAIPFFQRSSLSPAPTTTVIHNGGKASPLKVVPWDMCVTERGNEEMQTSVTTPYTKSEDIPIRHKIWNPAFKPQAYRGIPAVPSLLSTWKAVMSRDLVPIKTFSDVHGAETPSGGAVAGRRHVVMETLRGGKRKAKRETARATPALSFGIDWNWRACHLPFSTHAGSSGEMIQRAGPIAPNSFGGRSLTAGRELASHQVRFPPGFAPGFSRVGIVLDDAASQRVFSGISSFIHPCTPALPHTHFTSPSSTLETSML